MSGLICLLLQAYTFILLVRIVLSWFPLSGGAIVQVYDLLRSLTEPVLAPLRRVLPPVRMGAVALDLSPIVVFLVLQVLSGAFC
ncbi:MAG: hypothetical protein KatS3mg008_0081 [Acidimicrobiales bacterium]|nr:MAG: hypothetical protein KatS3mg008_0081 [Acidimicrobiales bacterium]